MNGDISEKEVTWCEKCKAHKCAKCQGLVRSVKGFVLDKIGRLVSMS